MSGEKQKVSPLTEPALPHFNFQFLILNLIRMFSDELEKNILGRDDKSHLFQKQMPTYTVHWVKKSIWMSTTLWR